MKERPILFSAPMVRALLDGRKTQTRRVVKADFTEELDFLGGAATDCDAPGVDIRWGEMQHDDSGDSGKPQWLACCRDYPEEGFIELGAGYGAIGDQLWVRETFIQGHPYDAVTDRILKCDANGNDLPVKTWYRADNSGITWSDDDGFETNVPWKPSIHMPRRASRITLEITGVRVERLHDISEADAIAEGVTAGKYTGLERATARTYSVLWESINGPDSWAANPWVWVLEFKRVQP